MDIFFLQRTVRNKAISKRIQRSFKSLQMQYIMELRQEKTIVCDNLIISLEKAEKTERGF